MSRSRLKILLYVYVLFSALFALSSICLYFYSTRYLEKKGGNLFKSQAEDISRHIDRCITTGKTDLGLFLADRAIADYFMFSEVGLLDEAEDVRWKLEGKFLNIAKVKPVYCSFNLLGLDGISVVNIIHKQIYYKHFDFSEAPWFQENLRLQRDEWHVGSMTFCKECKINELRMSKMYFDDTGRPKGMVSVLVHIDDFFADALPRRIGENGYAYLIDRGGIIVGHRDNSKIGLGTEGLVSTKNVLAGRRGTTKEKDETGKTMLKTYFPLKIEDLALVVAQPVSEITAFGRPLRLFILAVCIVTILFVSAIAHAITRLRQSERESRRTSVELNQIFNTSADAMCVVDTNLTLLRVNNAYLTLAGVSMDEAVGKKCYEVFSGAKCDTSGCTLYRIINGEQRIEYEVEKQRNDGTRVHCLLTATPFCGPDGAIIGIVENFKDISERKKAEEEIQAAYQSQTLLNNLLHNSLKDLPLNEILKRFISQVTSIPWFELESKGAIFLVEDHDTKKLVMKAHHNLNGRIQKLCANVPFGRCLCGRAAAAGEILFADCVGEDHEIRYEGIPPHGHYCVPVWSAEKIIGMLTMYVEEGHHPREKEKQFLNAVSDVLTGIIQRKRAEEDRLKLERQLLQSEKMASVGQLAAGVAHEINNPTGFVNSNLNTLNGYQNDIHGLLRLQKKLIADMKDADLPSFLEKQVEEIAAFEAEIDVDFILDDIPNLIGDCKDGTERIKKIVSDLKDFAHPGEDKSQSADINKGLDSTLNVVWNELKYKAKVIKDYGDLPQVECYPQQLNQVFMNILVNAAQAIEKDGEIKISTKAVNGQVEITITDTGAGIPEEALPKIFDPFFTTKDVGKGTGLGLNVAYNIIKKHNGTIDVNSTEGQGTTFTIKIPVGDE